MSYLVWRSQWLLLNLQENKNNKGTVRQPYQAYVLLNTRDIKVAILDQYNWLVLSSCFPDRGIPRSSTASRAPLQSLGFHSSWPPFTSPLGEGEHYLLRGQQPLVQVSPNMCLSNRDSVIGGIPTPGPPSSP